MTIFVILIASCVASFNRPLTCEVNLGNDFFMTKEACQEAIKSKSKDHKCVSVKAVNKGL